VRVVEQDPVVVWDNGLADRYYSFRCTSANDDVAPNSDSLEMLYVHVLHNVEQCVLILDEIVFR
jgi:hypothetical protein